MYLIDVNLLMNIYTILKKLFFLKLDVFLMFFLPLKTFRVFGVNDRNVLRFNK